jgi:carboxyl-terminal processing protease
VRDGGGITPDIVMVPDSMPNIVYYLSTSGLDSTEVMLQYEVDYMARHPQIAKPSEFEISDADYAEFRQRVLSSGFKYDAESRKYMETLKKLMVFEGYFDDAKSEFEALERKLKHNLEKDMDRHEDIIRQALSMDLIAAYYYQQGSLEYSLKHDKLMHEACRLLNNVDEYHRLLRP